MAEKRRSSGLPEKAALSLHACSSEDGVHKASNVVLDVLYRQWQTSGPSDSAWITVDLDPPSAIQRLAINNAGSALVEVYGLQEGVEEGNTADASADVSGYEMLLPAQQFMSASDVREKKNTNREFVYEAGVKLLKSAAEHKWQRLKLVCKQPFGPAEEPIGLARVRVFPCKTPAEEAANSRHAAREARIQAAVAASDDHQKKTSPPSFQMPLAKLSDEPADLADPPPRDPPKPAGKRVLPSWLSCSPAKPAKGPEGREKGKKRGADEEPERERKRSKGRGDDREEREGAKGERNGGQEKGREKGGGRKRRTSAQEEESDEEEETDRVEAPSTRAETKKGPDLKGNRGPRARASLGEEDERDAGQALPSDVGGAAAGGITPFEKLLDGVTFAISGIQNPERGKIREQGEEMGATYRGDWGGECTLLVCAFKGTPKFNQVKKANGTIVDRSWIPECYKRGELVDIDEHMLHPGKPWRKQTAQSTEEEDELGDREADIGTAFAEADEPSGARTEQARVTDGLNGKRKRHTTEGKIGKAMLEEGVGNGTKGRKGGEREGGESATDVDVAKWVDADVADAERFLKGEGAEPGPGETMRDLGIQGVLGCFDFMVEELEEGRTLEEAKDGWVAALPRGVEEVCKSVGENVEVAITALCEMKGRYERGLESDRKGFGGEQRGKQPSCKERHRQHSDAETEGWSDDENEGTPDTDVILLSREEVAMAKEKLIRRYGKGIPSLQRCIASVL